MRFSVRAPASSANLGPGFDALGLALDLWNTVEIDLSETNEVLLAGGGAALLSGRENLTLTAMELLAKEHGKTLPPLTMTLQADVPVARGLGSSAAAIVSGLVAANYLLELDLTTADLFAVAARMEGHGDNVGAALYGGAILSVPGLRDAIRLTDGPSLGLVAVVFVPEATGATWVARGDLPQLIPHADATYNVGTASGLAVGLMTANRQAISAGMHDRLHEPARSRLFPHLLPLTEAARNAGAIGTCLSGAGPSILALVEPDEAERIANVLNQSAERIAVPGAARILSPAPQGAFIANSPARI
jgi:homoserine kinase